MKEIEKLKPFTRFLMTIGEIPSSYLISMTYEEQLLWFCNYLKNTVIPALNNNAEAVIELQNFVTNYFENLDVQEEINNKLDEMATDGTLEEIISSYLQVSSLLMYDTLEDMKNATNLINGSFAKTLGYRNINDNGGAFYKIRNVTNQDTENDMDIIALSNETLVAELITNDLNIKQFGAYGDNENNDTSIFKYAITYCNNKKINLIIPEGTYLINEEIGIPYINIIGNDNTILNFNGTAQNIYATSNNILNLHNIVITNGRIGTQINTTNIKNSKIFNCKFDINGYGILINYNTDGSEDILIKNNNIKALDDGIEVNTISTNSNKCKNIIIDGNFIECPLLPDSSNPTTAGFAIGIATGKNIVVTNNISKFSRQEGLHVEDGSENIIVSNNIFDGCLLDGARIYVNDSKSTESPMITNNIIKSYDKETNNNIGLYLVYDNKGYNRINILSNNIINGFKTGLYYDGLYGIATLDGTIIKNCENGLSTNGVKDINGNISFENVTKLIIIGSNNSIINIDSINSLSPIDYTNLVNISGNNNTVNFRKIQFITKNTVETQQNYHSAGIFNNPKFINGQLEIRVTSNNVSSIKIFDINYNSTDGLTKKLLSTNESGTIVNDIRINSSSLESYIYAPNLVSGNIITQTIIFNGNITF